MKLVLTEEEQFAYAEELKALTTWEIVHNRLRPAQVMVHRYRYLYSDPEQARSAELKVAACYAEFERRDMIVADVDSMAGGL